MGSNPLVVGANQKMATRPAGRRQRRGAEVVIRAAERRHAAAGYI
jgi:hypothetical protein